MSELQSVGSQPVLQPIIGRSDNADIAGSTGYNNTIAQATRGSDARLASASVAAKPPSIDNQKVDSLAKEIKTTPEFKSRDLAQKIHTLSVPERNSLLSKLGNQGRGVLATEMYKASTRNPMAYQSMVKDLTNGIPPQQIKSLIDAGTAFNTANNPVGQYMATTLTHDIAVEVASNGTKGQKLGLIDTMTDPRTGGLAASQKFGGEAVGELFKGLKGDVGAIDAALKMMSQSDKMNVAKQTLATDDANGIKQVLRYVSASTDAPQKAQMLEQFMTSLDSVQGDKKKAALDGITASILKSPNSVLTALRPEDQPFKGNGGYALSTYIANVLESSSPQVLQDMMAALKYGDNRGGKSSPSQLERTDFDRFNAPDKQNASTRGYFVGSFDKAISKLEKEGKDANSLSRNAWGSSIDVVKTILSNTPAVKEFKVAIDLGATGLKAVNSQFNNASQLDAASTYKTLIDIGRPTIPGTNGAPQLAEQGNSPAYAQNVDRSDRTR